MTEKVYNIHARVQMVRRDFMKGGLTKEVEAFNFKYISLAQISPRLAELFCEHGVSEHVNYIPSEKIITKDAEGNDVTIATQPILRLTLTNWDDQSDSMVFEVPYFKSNLKGAAQEMQNASASITFGRRLLYMMALNLSEAEDQLDKELGESNERAAKKGKPVKRTKDADTFGDDEPKAPTKADLMAQVQALVKSNPDARAIMLAKTKELGKAKLPDLELEQIIQVLEETKSELA